MTTKTYGVHGRATAVLRIPTGNGKASIIVEFTRGLPSAGSNYRPATYVTSDPVEQDILESSSLFGKMYTLVGVSKNEAEKPATEQPKGITPLDGILTKEEAVSYLKSQGAKAIELRSAEAILKTAEKYGVSFPNLTI